MSPTASGYLVSALIGLFCALVVLDSASVRREAGLPHSSVGALLALASIGWFALNAVLFAVELLWRNP